MINKVIEIIVLFFFIVRLLQSVVFPGLISIDN